MSEREKNVIAEVISKAAETDDRAAEAVQAFASGLASGIEIGKAQAAQTAEAAPDDGQSRPA